MIMEFREIKTKVSNLYADESATAGDYISIWKKIKALNDDGPEYMRKAKIAFLSSFTVQGLPEVISASAFFHNFFVRTYNAPYNQFTQEVLNPKSGLYEFFVYKKNYYNRSYYICVGRNIFCVQGGAHNQRRAWSRVHVLRHGGGAGAAGG